MLLSRDVRRKLADLRGDAAHGAAANHAPDDAPAALVIAPSLQMPPGLAVADSLGGYLSIRLTPADVGPWAEQLTARAFAELAASEIFPTRARHELAFLDIETTGLAAAPLFLVGVLHVGDSGLHIHQLLARDYAEEPAVLAAAIELLSAVKVLVSFNGRSFDVPFVHDRLRYHRMEWTVQPERHVDMLHVARRQHDLHVPDHRLITLETCVCRRRRAGDIPGELIPGAYHRFVESGETDELAVILQHNQIDLLTTAELAGRWPHGASPPALAR